MTPEHDTELCQAFPNLYRDRRGSPQDTCMVWGFECGDGWFELIKELSAKLEAMILALPEERRAEVKAAQVKEKFGGLRFYLDGGTVDMYAAISAAEARSNCTCEACGKPGTRRGGGWIVTLCDEHDAEREAAKRRGEQWRWP